MDGVGNDDGTLMVKGRELELEAELETETFTVPWAAVSA
jgi:hypothetical protein